VNAQKGFPNRICEYQDNNNPNQGNDQIAQNQTITVLIRPNFGAKVELIVNTYVPGLVGGNRAKT
jgi:archaellin